MHSLSWILPARVKKTLKGSPVKTATHKFNILAVLGSPQGLPELHHVYALHRALWSYVLTHGLALLTALGHLELACCPFSASDPFLLNAFQELHQQLLGTMSLLALTPLPLLESGIGAPFVLHFG